MLLKKCLTGICFFLLIIFSAFSARAQLFDNGDGTVSDTSTGLMWQQATPPGIYTWAEALSYCENLVHPATGGFSDWRLPTIKELDSNVDASRFNPTINTGYFSDTLSSEYWSSTTIVNSTESAWMMRFFDGFDAIDGKGTGHYVRAVRGGQNRISGNLFILSPSQGSTWSDDMVMPIRWETRDLGGDVRISISRDGGNTFTPIIDVIPNNGSFDWTVAGTGSARCALKVTPIGSSAKATIQSLFFIDNCPDDPNKIDPGDCGCGTPDIDSDGDKILDCIDNFPDDPIDPGDLNNDGQVDLTDAILVLKIMAGIDADIYSEAGMNTGGKIGLAEEIYILQKISGLR